MRRRFILRIGIRRYMAYCLVLFCAVGAAHSAFTIEPMVLTFNAAVGERVVWIDVVNTGDGPIAVELTVFERVLDLDGEVDRTNLVPCKDFTVYPSEIILHPKEKASVQLMYKDKQKITADKAYSLFSKEVLMPLEEDETEGINVNVPIVVSYYTVINLKTGKEGKLTFVSSKAIKDGKIEVIVENKSGGRVVAKNLAIKTDTDTIIGFTGTKNSILPGQKRRFTFKYFRPLIAREVKFIYDYSESD